jgi:hypothetical protein
MRCEGHVHTVDPRGVSVCVPKNKDTAHTDRYTSEASPLAPKSKST